MRLKLLLTILKIILHYNMSKNNTIRVRFAPSPTGYLHIGASRTALFNFLYAKKMGGKFILRIEDTDKERSANIYEQDIMRSMQWIGINWDEGGEEGKFGPYRQSERAEIYKKYIHQLLDEKKAYYCFCDKEKLEKRRIEQQKRKEAPRYTGNCFSLSKKEINNLLEQKNDFTIRIRVPENEVIEFDDLIKGKVKFNSSDIGGDFVIAKSDFSPLYNFACAVDDYEMNISHIIRGEDHISNTPKQIIAYKAIGAIMPKFAHLPLILGPDKQKLSKRHGAASLYEYKNQGYLPDALINFIVLLGWHPSTDSQQEIYTIEEIINNFSLEGCQKSPAIFDIDKLNYINGYYIRSKKIKEITKLCIPFFVEQGIIEKREKDNDYYSVYKKEKIEFEKIKEIVSLYKDRMKKFSEIGDLTRYLFNKEDDYEKDQLIWKDSQINEIIASIDKSIEILSKNNKWNKEYVEKELMDEANRYNDRGKFLWPLRVALSGKKASAGPFDIAYVLGKKECIERLERAKEKLNTQ